MNLNRFGIAAICILLAPALPVHAQPMKATSEPPTANAVSTALAFVQQYGLPKALTPAADRKLKIDLITSLTKSTELPWKAVSSVIDQTVFEQLSGGGTAIPVTAMEKHLKTATPQSRNALHEKTRLHAALLTTQFDLIDDGHRAAAAELVTWMAENYKPGQPLNVIIICTGNTRRSMLGATMGNIAAAYYGLPEIRFFSGGTNPDAFNPRTIATLKEIGVKIEPTGKEATRGSADKANPIYTVQWGQGLETVEFSKKYTDLQNPNESFAAVLVCSEADGACPSVKGASTRIPVPYLDPKAFDGAPFEAGKYAERRDDIGRFMLSVLMQSRRQLELDGKLK